jgi:hypothetical protein
METKDVITTIAVIIGPIAAIQIQRWLDSYRENRKRKLDVFKTLMSTRATRVSINHIQALNMIDVEFVQRRYKKVTDSWRLYQDHLSNRQQGDNGWLARTDELFIDMLFEMGKSLGYKFDKVMLKRTAYSPIAHGDIEFEQQIIRQGLAKVLSGHTSFPIYVVNAGFQEPAPEEEVQ